MGYGPRVQALAGEPYVYHSGTAPGAARASAGFLPERGVGVNTPDVRICVLGQGVLALVAGHSLREVVLFLALRRKVRSVAGTDESPHGNATRHVEPAGSSSYIEISQPGWEFPAFPESTDPDDCAFYSVRTGGWRGAVEFHETGAGMEFRVDDQRLRRTGAERSPSAASYCRTHGRERAR